MPVSVFVSILLVSYAMYGSNSQETCSEVGSLMMTAGDVLTEAAAGMLQSDSDDVGRWSVSAQADVDAVGIHVEGGRHNSKEIADLPSHNIDSMDPGADVDADILAAQDPLQFLDVGNGLTIATAAEIDAAQNESGFMQSDIGQYFGAELAKMDPDVLDILADVQFRCPKVKVLVSGMPRAGSTSLLTIAHIWLHFCDSTYMAPSEDQSSLYIDDNNTCDQAANVPKFCWDYFQNGTSSVAKTHMAKHDARMTYPDVILFSHRSPDSMMASQWLSFYKHCDAIPCAGWPNAMRELDRQACLYDRFDSNKIKYDMWLDHLVHDQRAVLAEVGRVLGVTLNGEVPEQLLNHAEHIYDQVRRVIQSGVQVPHHSDNNVGYRQEAQRLLSRGWTYLGRDELGNPFHTKINGSVWLGDIASNPLMTAIATDNGVEYRLKPELKSHFTLPWCRT